MSLSSLLDQIDDWLDRNKGKYVRFRPPRTRGRDEAQTPPSFVRVGDEIRHFPGGLCYAITGDGLEFRARNCPLAEWVCGGRRERCPLRCGGDFARHPWRWSGGTREAGTN